MLSWYQHEINTLYKKKTMFFAFKIHKIPNKNQFKSKYRRNVDFEVFSPI